MSRLLCVFVLMIAHVIAASAATGDVGTHTITLTQTGCQFLEPEGKDRHFRTSNARDCVRINDTTGLQRLQQAKPMRLKSGRYIFRVTNHNVPYPLGFWLRGQGVGRLLLPSISGGGIGLGASKDYRITLKPGRYFYSCPLNPTPDYSLIVD